MVAGILLSSIPAPAYAVIYSPGETLNPNCLPTDTNCEVDASNIKGRLNSALTGTVSISPGSNLVIGTSTVFTTELSAGDSIKIGSDTFTVSAISSNTQLALTSAVASSTATTTGATAYRDPVNLFSVSKGNGSNVLAVTRAGLLALVNALTLSSSTPTSTANALYNSGGTLYWNGTALGLAGSGLQNLNGLATSTQTFAIGNTGTDFGIISSGSVHTFNLPSASGTARGLVSTSTQTFAGDKTFGNALIVNGASTLATTTASSLTLSPMTAGSLLFAGTSGLVSQNNAGLFWDNTNSRLGIGTTNPSATLEISPGAAIASQWTLRSGAGFLGFKSVTYGTGVFVAVADTNALSTSPDGVTWTQRSVPSASIWRSVTYSNGTFVAVGSVGGVGTVMTSPDGITWTNRTPAANNDWYSVTYGNALFVAVATSGTGNRVMTSPDGITWTARTSASDDMWRSVTYGNGLFVAVSYVGSTYRVMTSPDGIAWTGRSATNGAWNSVTYGGGLFVAVAESSPYVMTSPDGITWTNRTAAANNAWTSVAYGNGVFVAVSNTGTGNRVMTSSDGITWTSRTSAADNGWRGVVFGNNFFVAVADAEVTSNQRVMTSSGAIPTVIAANGSITATGNAIIGGALNVTGASTLATMTANNLTLSPITQGSLLFAGAGGLVSQNNAGLFWDNTNSRLGIGTTTPGSKLDVKGTLRLSGATSGYVGLAPADVAGSTTYTLPSADGTSGQALTTNGSGALSWSTGSSQWTTSGSNIYYNTGNVAIGTSTPSATARLLITGAVSTTSTVPISATGGTITTSGLYTIHTFTGSGTFTPNGAVNVDHLVIGGGGGGSSGTAGTDADGSGGGAGGFLTANTTVSGATTVTVGAGGAGGTSLGSSPAPGTAAADGSNGQSSLFGGSITAAGGGGGGSRERAGKSGASGGGAGVSGTALAGGTATPAGQGNAGGANGGASNYGGGGGGGAGAVGQNGSTVKGGDGGAGSLSSISGTSQTYAGGGGSGRFGGGGTAGVGGTGGGGNLGAAGATNTGGGGGGGVINTLGKAGGSGVVIVRYLTSATVTVAVSNANQALLRVTDTGTGASTTLAFFEGTSGQGCIIAGATGLSCSSDISLKRNVQTLGSDTLGNVLALKAVTFDWNNEADGTGNHIGFIAQDVEKIFPGLVVTDPNGKKALSYDKFAPIIVKALQEQYGGMMGINLVSVSNYAELFSSTTTLDHLAQAPAGEDFIADPISYIRERVQGGINIVRNIVTERVVAVSGYFKRIFANELCLTDSSGKLVCVTGDALKNLNGAEIKTIQSEENRQTPIIDVTPNQSLQNSDGTGQVSSPQAEENQPATTEVAPLPEASTSAPVAVDKPAGETVEKTEQTQTQAEEAAGQETVVKEPIVPVSVAEPELAPTAVSNPEPAPEPVTEQQPVAQPESTSSN